jgi:murein DD-endopeptidase MepM/ murein hydrolase activator NlpD
MRRASAYTAILAVLAVLSFGAAQPNDPREAKRRADAELARTAALLESASAQAQAALAKLTDLNNDVTQAKTVSAAARAAVAAAEKEAALRQQRAGAAKAVADAAAQKYKAAADRVQLEKERLGRFAAVAYQGGGVAEFNAFVGSNSPREFMLRAEYARQVAELQKEAIDGYAAATQDAMRLAKEAGAAQDAADQKLTAAKAALAKAASARDDALRNERVLTELLTKQQAAVAEAEQYRAEVLAQYNEAQRESERVAAELQAWEAAQNGGSPVLRPGARLLMPASGRKSSDFGYRFHPIYHVWLLHTGMDIAAGNGQPIRAAAAGQVVLAGMRGGSGNYTCIAHGTYQGKNLSTCYAHQSRILVSVGQRVSAGQLIGRVGTTGTSTGYHLHFEVRLNGTPVDPKDWLPACLC